MAMESKEVVLGDPDLVDISLQVSDTVFKCHKYPLARVSQVLSSLFRRDRSAQLYHLGDDRTWNPRFFECVLKSVYSEDVSLQLDGVVDVLCMLNSLQIENSLTQRARGRFETEILSRGGWRCWTAWMRALQIARPELFDSRAVIAASSPQRTASFHLDPHPSGSDSSTSATSSSSSSSSSLSISSSSSSLHECSRQASEGAARLAQQCVDALLLHPIIISTESKADSAESPQSSNWVISDAQLVAMPPEPLIDLLSRHATMMRAQSADLRQPMSFLAPRGPTASQMSGLVCRYLALHRPGIESADRPVLPSECARALLLSLPWLPVAHGHMACLDTPLLLQLLHHAIAADTGTGTGGVANADSQRVTTADTAACPVSHSTQPAAPPAADVNSFKDVDSAETKGHLHVDGAGTDSMAPHWQPLLQNVSQRLPQLGPQQLHRVPLPVLVALFQQAFDHASADSIPLLFEQLHEIVAHFLTQCSSAATSSTSYVFSSSSSFSPPEASPSLVRHLLGLLGLHANARPSHDSLLHQLCQLQRRRLLTCAEFAEQLLPRLVDWRRVSLPALAQLSLSDDCPVPERLLLRALCRHTLSLQHDLNCIMSRFGMAAEAEAGSDEGDEINRQSESHRRFPSALAMTFPGNGRRSPFDSRSSAALRVNGWMTSSPADTHSLPHAGVQRQKSPLVHSPAARPHHQTGSGRHPLDFHTSSSSENGDPPLINNVVPPSSFSTPDFSNVDPARPATDSRLSPSPPPQFHSQSESMLDDDKSASRSLSASPVFSSHSLPSPALPPSSCTHESDSESRSAFASSSSREPSPLSASLSSQGFSSYSEFELTLGEESIRPIVRGASQHPVVTLTDRLPISAGNGQVSAASLSLSATRALQRLVTQRKQRKHANGVAVTSTPQPESNTGAGHDDVVAKTGPDNARDFMHSL